MNLMQDDPFEVKTITQTVTVKVLTRYRSKPNGKIETNTTNPHFINATKRTSIGIFHLF